VNPGGAWVLVIAKSGSWATLTVSLPELLAELVSPPPLTVAVLVMDGGALPATLTTSEIGG
jgi:hypothetical protein